MILTYEACLIDKKPLTSTTTYYSFSRPSDSTWSFAAGQYMIFHIPQEGGNPARRLYSIASTPSDSEIIGFIIEHVPQGLGTTHLTNMNIGDKLTMQGPAGVFIFKKSPRNPVFMATGTGIAPIYSIVKELTTEGYTNPLNVFWGMKKKDEYYFESEFKNIIESNSSLQVTICFSREETIADTVGLPCLLGHVNDGLEQKVIKNESDYSSFDYYLCGSKGVVESLRMYLKEKNVPQEQIFFEKFTT